MLQVKGLLQTVEYCINGQHFFSFEVVANVVPVSLDLSAEELLFQFDMTQWATSVQRTLTLRNPQSMSLEFKWEINNPAFTVSPVGGSVPARFNQDVVFTWTPGLTATDDSSKSIATLRFIGATSSQRVRLHGEVPERNLKFLGKDIDTGDVPCAVEQTAQLVVRNSGVREAAFRVLPNPQLKVSLNRGRIQPGGSMDIVVDFMAADPGPMTTYLEIEPMCGKVIKAAIKATGVIPNCDILQKEFSLATTYIGSYTKAPLTLSNPSNVVAIYNLNLSANPEFSLVLPKENWSTDEYESSPLLKFDQDGRPTAVGLSKLASQRMSRRMSQSDLKFKPPTMAEIGNKFQVTINPNSSLELNLTYRPAMVEDHKFDIQLMLQTDADVEVQPISRRVAAKGMFPRLLLSKTAVDFEQRIVLRSGSSFSRPYIEEIFVRNNTEEDMKVHFGEPKSTALIAVPTSANPLQSVFKISPPTITLEGGEGDYIQVNLKFLTLDFMLYIFRPLLNADCGITPENHGLNL